MIKERAEIENRRMPKMNDKEAIEYVDRKDPRYIDTRLQLRNHEEQLHRLESDLMELRELLFTDRETSLRISLLMRDIDSLKSEIKMMLDNNRWIMGITITVFLGLFVLVISILFMM
jgi:hypothetical protein